MNKKKENKPHSPERGQLTLRNKMTLQQKLTKLSNAYPTLTVKNLAVILSFYDMGKMTVLEAGKFNGLEHNPCTKQLLRFTNKMNILEVRNQEKGGRLYMLRAEVRALFNEIFDYV